MQIDTRKVLEITTKIGCTVACRFCPQTNLAKSYAKNKVHPQYLTLGDFINCITKLPREVYIDFAGFTEPFLNKSTIDMMMYARQKGHGVRLFTTLQGITLKEARQLIGFNFSKLSIHLPSANIELERYKLDQEYYDVLKFFTEQFEVHDFVYHGSSYHESLMKVLSDEILLRLNKLYTNTRASNLNLENFDTLQNRKPIDSIKGKIACRRKDWHVLIPNGDVILCCMDYSLQHKIGNLLLDSYEDVWAGLEMKRLEEEQLKEDSNILCRTCDCFVYKLEE